MLCARCEILQYYSAPESVMEKVGIGLDGQKTGSLGDGETLACRICCDEYKGEEAYALACNHFFCRGCWAAYLSAKVGDTLCGERACCYFYGSYAALGSLQLTALGKGQQLRRFYCCRRGTSSHRRSIAFFSVHAYFIVRAF